MKYEIIKNDERGKSDYGWLKSRFSFSFGNYYNPKQMGFGKLRVLNDDIIAPEHGFDMHPHDNMEIISIVTEGTLSHKDSMGNLEDVKAGEIQVMSAGSGLLHSEFNNSKTKPVQLFQLWIFPKEKDIKPTHSKMKLDLKSDELFLIVSGKKNKDSLTINQDAKIHLGKLSGKKKITYSLNKNRGLYLFVIDGECKLNDIILKKRDAIAIEGKVDFTLSGKCYVLLVESDL
ncbi:MAG: pirin family protein [Candidatus Woesearchaeota archaeon]